MTQVFDMKSWELAAPENIKDLCWDRDTFASSHKFFMGRREHYDVKFLDYGSMLIDQGIIRLPFDYCVFEYISNIGEDFNRIVALCSQDKLFNIDIWIAILVKDEWSFINAPLRLVNGESKFYLPNNAGHDKEIENLLMFGMDLCITSVAIISSNSFIQKEVVIPTKVQKARDKSGKPPLYEFKTVELRPQHEIRNPPIGTHASPRLHWRRGHYRWVPTKEKYTPIPPMLVGKPEYGVVEKEYDARLLGDLV